MADTGSAHGNRRVFERLIAITGSEDLAGLDEVLHPDFVQEIPQSGERVVGIDNFRRILEGFREQGAAIGIRDDPYIMGGHEHYVMTPTFNVVKMTDDEDELTSYVKARYPDGTDWYIISFSTFKDGKVIKRVDFFAPFFEAPEWRSAWVEKF